MRTLYAVGPRRWRVWFVVALSVAAAVGGVWLGLVLGQTYGLHPAEGGVLAPLPVRLAWAFALSALGLGFLGGMVAYARCYVVRLDYDAGTAHVRTLLGERAVPVDHFAGARHHAGQLTLRQHVDAPWISLRVRGRRLPYILDLQGEVMDADALDRLGRGRPVAP